MKSLRLVLAVLCGFVLSFALLALLNMLALSSVAAAPVAGIRYVSDFYGADAGDCTDQSAPCLTVQYALAQAAVGDTIQVANSYSPAVYTGTIVITKSITLEGGWATVSHPSGSLFWQRPSPCETFRTTLDAQRAGRVISITNGAHVAIDCFVITGGDATGLAGTVYGYDVGGGIHSYYSYPTVTNCVITDNIASTSGIGWGGGFSFYGGNATLSNTLVISNVASTASSGYGGGGYTRFGSAALSGCTVVSNVGTTHSAAHGYGGGLWLANGTAGLAGNTIRGNLAGSALDGYGGGIDVYGGTATLDGDVIEDNLAVVSGTGGRGGGVSVRFGADFTAVGVEITGNEGTFGGGLHVADSAEVELTNNDVFSNVAGMGGGFYFTGSPTATLAINYIFSNTSGYGGGGLFMGSDGATLAANTIHDNTSAGLAGGIWLNGSDGATLVRNFIISNTADGDGGGLHIFMSDDTTLENNVIVDNRIAGSGEGVGIRVDDSSVTLLYTTLARNSGGDGSGISAITNSTLSLTNTLIASHTVGVTATAGTAVTFEGTLWGTGDWANGTTTGGAGVFDHGETIVLGTPGFVDPDRGNYHIGPGSDAVDVGVDAGVAMDIDGDGRPIGAAPDIGADEAWLWLFQPVVLRGY